MEVEVLSGFHAALAKDSHRRTPEISGVPHVSHFVYACDRPIFYDMTAPYPAIGMKGSVITWIGRKLRETNFLGVLQ